jgi:hypothetical protein
MATSYHSYGRFIDYPYACSTGVAGSLMPEHLVIEELMWGVADAIERVDGVAYQVYCPVPFGGVNGDDTSWYYAHRGTYALIIEAGLRFAPPFADAEGIVRRNRGGWRYLYERLGQARIDVRVLDACDRKPLEATVTLADFSYDHGELRRWTRPPFGRWTYLVVGNHEYTVRAARGGYQTQEVTVEVGEKPVPIDILLEPAEACTDVAGGIPTVSEWGLCAIALLLLCAGSILAGRRRAA